MPYKDKETQAKHNVEYAKKNVVRIPFDLNRNTDADILEFLDNVPNRNAAIKFILRAWIKGVMPMPKQPGSKE